MTANGAVSRPRWRTGATTSGRQNSFCSRPRRQEVRGDEWGMVRAPQPSPAIRVVIRQARADATIRAHFGAGALAFGRYPPPARGYWLLLEHVSSTQNGKSGCDRCAAPREPSSPTAGSGQTSRCVSELPGCQSGDSVPPERPRPSGAGKVCRKIGLEAARIGADQEFCCTVDSTVCAGGRANSPNQWGRSIGGDHLPAHALNNHVLVGFERASHGVIAERNPVGA